MDSKLDALHDSDGPAKRGLCLEKGGTTAAGTANMCRARSPMLHTPPRAHDLIVPRDARKSATSVRSLAQAELAKDAARALRCVDHPSRPRS